MLPIYQKALIIEFFIEHRCWDWVFKVQLEKTIGFVFWDAFDDTIIKLNEYFNKKKIWRS